MSFKFSRGVYVIDKITHLKGCITGRLDSITGCNQYYVAPEVDKDGKHIDGRWIDEHSLIIDPSRQQLKLSRDENQPPG